MSQQINLFNPVFLKQKKVFSAVPMAQTLALIIIGVLVLDWVAFRRMAELERNAAAGKTMLAEREARLAKASAEFAPRGKSAALESDLVQAQAELTALRSVREVLDGGSLGNTAGYAEYFRAFSRQNVNGLWLTGVTIIGAGSDIAVQGRAMQPTLVPNYIARLTAEPVMRGKTFASLSITRPAGETAPAAAAAPAPAISPELSRMAGLSTGPAADPAAGKAASPAAGGSPFVEFSLQSSAVEVAK